MNICSYVISSFLSDKTDFSCADAILFLELEKPY